MLPTCSQRAVRSLAGVLAQGPGPHVHAGEMQQELITSQLLKTTVNTWSVLPLSRKTKMKASYPFIRQMKSAVHLQKKKKSTKKCTWKTYIYKKKNYQKNVHGKHTKPHTHLSASFKCHRNLVTKEQHDLFTFPWGMCLLSKGCPRLSYVCFKFLASPWFHFYLICLSFTLLFISEAFWQAV